MPSPLAHGRRSASGLLSNLASPRAPQSRSRSNSSTAVEYSEEEGLMSHTQDPHSCEGDAVCNSPSAPGGHHFPSTQIPSSASAGQHQSERPVFSNPFDMPFNINYAGVRSSHAPCLGLRDMRRGSALPPHCLREKHAQVVLEAAVDRRRASIDVAALTARSGGVPQPLAVRRGSKRLRTYQDSDDEFQNTNGFLAKNMQALSRESMLVTCFR